MVREQMLTSRDDEIRRTDWPERAQVAPRPGGTPTDGDGEARWILERMMVGGPSYCSPPRHTMPIDA